MSAKKLAIILPGTGYHKDKPLLYYGTKLAMSCGYEIKHVDYLECFNGIRYKDTEMAEAAVKAFAKTEEVLREVDFSQYEEVVFIGKSFGTVVGAKYAAEHALKAKQVWYTPVSETFKYRADNAVAFTGSADPIADTAVLRAETSERGIPLHVYEGGNHSLETGDVARDLETLQDVMRITKGYIE
ncbi:MAG: alpha/beta hydrolase [Lachnospiraceae bacterium]|nr:alpha/beta hydrolase [Lachnospiraceae bacterium]